MTRILGVLGTGSSVGKTALCAALGRQLADAGIRVAPFKPQNMATNAAPALRADGSWGEIGTGQYLQAIACRQPPRTAMNPVLLKPVGGGRCEVVVDGRVLATEDWSAYRRRAPELKRLVRHSLQVLTEQSGAEVVVLEGAGSCVELNLHDDDLGNVSLLRDLQAPWILVADIDRGGVYAQVVGTQVLLPEDWRRCLAVVVNRLRGDPAAFAAGAADLARRVARPVHVVPELPELHLPDEDTATLRPELTAPEPRDPSRRLLVALRLPHVAMSGDLAPVGADPAWQVRWCVSPPPEEPDAVVLPGSKLSGSDLAWLRGGPWAAWLQGYAARGGRVLGLCGGYQLLGERFSDHAGRDGPPGEQPGLGLLPVSTIATGDKLITLRSGRLADGVVVEGYEIRWGRSSRHGGAAVLRHAEGEDGCRVGTIAGTYLHGILSSAAARRSLLGAGSERSVDPVDRLAAHCASCGLSALGLLSATP